MSAGTMLICPRCRKRFNVDEAMRARGMEEMIRLASVFGECWPVVNEYIDAFRASQWGDVQLKKRVRLLLEIEKLWVSQVFEHQRKRYRTTRSAIREALHTVCNREMFNLSNHNYLKKVLVDGAERLSSEGLSASEESKRHAVGADPSTSSGQARVDGNLKQPDFEAIKKRLKVN